MFAAAKVTTKAKTTFIRDEGIHKTWSSPQDGISLSPKKKGPSDVGYDLDGP